MNNIGCFLYKRKKNHTAGWNDADIKRIKASAVTAGVPR